MWPSVNGNVLTNQIDIRSEKTHEVTRCKQALTKLLAECGSSLLANYYILFFILPKELNNLYTSSYLIWNSSTTFFLLLLLLHEKAA